MRIKKVSQTTATQAQVVDGYSTSTTDSYSCNYVNSVNTYSTNETVIGKWIDGKPLYRKVIQNNVIGTTVNHGISNIDEITDIKLIVLQQSGLYSPQNSDSIFIGDTDYIVYLQTTNVLNYKIIVEYTKTTD